ncbi:MAG: methyltransferase domain-containing protein, partial [Acidimicrobiales bacterium]
VLQHLADPVAVLKKVRPLLAEDGSVVASIPNAAHGSVRLALLNGSLDQRPLDQRDLGHRRFFTRRSVHELFREAGFLTVDLRRTTAGVFDTDLAIRRSDFDEGVVDAVEGDPESTTYQFVLRAIPEDSPPAIGATVTPSAALRSPCRLGLWSDLEPHDRRGALVLRITGNELSRRIPGATLRWFSAGEEPRPGPHDGGVPLEALGAWSPERARELAGELDCVVVTGDLPGGRWPGPLDEVTLSESEDDEGCPVLWSAVRFGPRSAPRRGAERPAVPAYAAVLDGEPGLVLDDAVTTVPDPLLLVPRLLRPDALTRRLQLARIMGWFPAEGPAVVVEVDGSVMPHAGALADALEVELARSGGAVVLVAEPAEEAARAADALQAAVGGRCHRLPSHVPVDDLVAVVAGATAVVAGSDLVALVALAYRRAVAQLRLGAGQPPAVLAHVTGRPHGVVTEPGQLAALLGDSPFRPDPATMAALQGRLDAHFDRVAAVATAAVSARDHRPSGRHPLPSGEYVAALELAHRRMQQRLEGERRAVAQHLASLYANHEAELARARSHAATLRAERDRLDAERQEAVRESTETGRRLREVEGRLEHTSAELHALRNTRILRVFRPARALYARIRGSRL